MAAKTHRVSVLPGERIEVVLVEKLENGYRDEVGSVDVFWQDRDAPTGEVATQHRELQIDWRAYGGKVGPVIVAAR